MKVFRPIKTNYEKHIFRPSQIPEVNLILAIIREAIKDNDYTFIYSDTCKYYSKLAGLNYQEIIDEVEKDN